MEPGARNDGMIVAAVLAGDKDQFGHLVARYEAPLYRLARSRLRNDAWAEEAVQETFLAAFRWLDSYDSRYSFRTWLWTILLNQCSRIAKRNGRQPRVSPWADYAAGRDESSGLSLHASPTPSPQPVCDRPGPSEQAAAREKSEQLELLLQELPDAQADALRLRFFGQMKFQEIADTMQCSLSTAKNRVRWGLAALSQRLQDTTSLEAFSFPARDSESRS